VPQPRESTIYELAPRDTNNILVLVRVVSWIASARSDLAYISSPAPAKSKTILISQIKSSMKVASPESFLFDQDLFIEVRGDHICADPGAVVSFIADS
jgi:hypothetical protein